MYVCLCHGVTDRQIKQAVKDGACTMEALTAHTGCGGTCGACVDEAKAIQKQVLCGKKTSEKNTVAVHVLSSGFSPTLLST